MKKRSIGSLTVTALLLIAMTLGACGSAGSGAGSGENAGQAAAGESVEGEAAAQEEKPGNIAEAPADTDTAAEDSTEKAEGSVEKDEEEAAEEPAPEEVPAFTGELIDVPEGMYLSELTGLPIPEELKEQRPIAVMVDNESKALPHFGTSECDIVYELMNSTANDRITRLMCIMKDWGSIRQLGSIRSTRPTNIPLCAEYNAVLCHDGGPYYINSWLSRDYAAHFSGTFSRVKNGKAWEFTEYILPGDLERNFRNSGYSTTYNEFRPERDTHFLFADYGTKVVLEDNFITYRTAVEVDLPFPHNASRLIYNDETGLYEYYEYGSLHKDAEDNEPLAFTNVILLDVTFAQLDQNGYLVYNIIDNTARDGYYLTGGEIVNISWAKFNETGLTYLYSDKGEELVINPGKTYIGIIPSDSFGDIVIRKRQ